MFPYRGRFVVVRESDTDRNHILSPYEIYEECKILPDGNYICRKIKEDTKNEVGYDKEIAV